MKPRLFAIVAGIALAIGGLFLASINVSITAKDVNPFYPALVTAQPVNCGSVWAGRPELNSFGLDATDVANKCDDAIGARAPWVYVLLGLGVLVAIGGAVVKTQSITQRTSDVPDAVNIHTS